MIYQAASIFIYIMNGLKVEQMRKSYQGKEVLKRVTFKLFEGEILALLGPCGCGKSTLLNIISSLEVQDECEIYWKGIDSKNIPTHKRGFSLVFQDFMLFPHKEIFSNVAFGLEIRKWDKWVKTIHSAGKGEWWKLGEN